MSPTILLAEDNPQDIFLTRRAFRKAGVRAELNVVTNGQEAVEYIRNVGQSDSAPRLILLDLRLPRLSGHEILAWMQDNEIQHLPAVVLSTSSETSDIDKALHLGARRYLCKPLNSQQLLALLEELGLSDLLPESS